jgi:hypothetical protein
MRNVKTTEMSEEQLAAVKIDRDRLWKDLHSNLRVGKRGEMGRVSANFSSISLISITSEYNALSRYYMASHALLPMLKISVDQQILECHV